MKNIRMIKLSVALLTTLTLIACNGGGSNGGGDPNPDPAPTPVVKPLPPMVTYTSDYLIDGEGTAESPVVNLRPYGNQINVTYTLKNVDPKIGIWFIDSSDGNRLWGFGNGGGEGDTSTYSSDDYDRSTKGWEMQNKFLDSSTCYNYSATNPLRPGQSCTIVDRVLSIMNYGNTESLVMNTWFGVNYAQDTHGGDDAGISMYITANLKSGIWYKNQQGYNNFGPITSFNVRNINGSDYIFLPESTPGQILKVNTFTNGVPQLNMVSDVVPCNSIAMNCDSDGSKLKPYGANVFFDLNDSSTLYYIAQWSYYPDGKNKILQGLDKYAYGRSGQNDNGQQIPNVSALWAVQPDGTLVGKNNNGKFGCFNNDGSNFREFESTYAAEFGQAEYQINNPGYWIYDTVSYQNTNWIKVNIREAGHLTLYYKVIANITGKCTLDPNNSMGDTVEKTFIVNDVDQTVQITPNGVYSTYGGAKMEFYKYPPRQ